MHSIFPQIQFPKRNQKTKPPSISTQQIHHKKYRCLNYEITTKNNEEIFLVKRGIEKIGYVKLHKRTHRHKCAYA